MVLVNVIKRFINIIPMQKSITQNDELSVTYRFQIARKYEDLDLGTDDWEWTLAWKNSLDIASAVFLTPVATPDYILLDWTPRWPETASTGMFEFQIRAKKDDLETGRLVKWNSQIARIDFNTSIGLGRIDRGILEDYLDKFMQLCSEATIDKEVRRAMAAEIVLSERIYGLEDEIGTKLLAISDRIDSLVDELNNVDTKVISNYEPSSEDKGEVDNTDTLAEAIAKLQYQIKNITIEGTIPVEKGGTGTSSFEGGIVYSEGGKLPFKSASGSSGEVLTIQGNKPTFKRISTADLSDEPSLLRFHALEETTVDISRFME